MTAPKNWTPFVEKFPTEVIDLGKFALDEWHEIRAERVT